MKRSYKFIVLFLIALVLCGCGPAAPKEPDIVTETDYVSIDGIYVDKSYVSDENGSLRMLYFFYTAKTDAENIKVCSKSSKLKINDTNEYTSGKFAMNEEKYFNSYYYSDFLEEIYVGNELKVLSTFKVPEGDLEAGRTMSFLPYGIPDGEKLKLNTDQIVFCDSAEEIAKAADPEGYKNYLHMNEVADDDTTKKVRNDINGYYWSFTANNTVYQIEFFSPDKFELRVPSLNVKNSGRYVVKNGYISCTYDSNGTTVDIPWSWNKKGEVDLELFEAFDVRS